MCPVRPVTYVSGRSRFCTPNYDFLRSYTPDGSGWIASTCLAIHFARPIRSMRPSLRLVARCSPPLFHYLTSSVRRVWCIGRPRSSPCSTSRPTVAMFPVTAAPTSRSRGRLTCVMSGRRSKFRSSFRRRGCGVAIRSNCARHRPLCARALAPVSPASPVRGEGDGLRLRAGRDCHGRSLRQLVVEIAA